MKTLLIVDKEIEEITQKLRAYSSSETDLFSSITNVADNPITEREANKLRVKLDMLRFTRKYLETNPSEEFVVNEQKRLKGFIEAKMGLYEQWKSGVMDRSLDPKQWQSTYNRETGISEAKRYLKTIKFILE